MPDPMNAQVDTTHGAGLSRQPWGDDGLLGVGWWLTGGASLLAWTGIALLLTSA